MSRPCLRLSGIAGLLALSACSEGTSVQNSSERPAVAAAEPSTAPPKAASNFQQIGKDRCNFRKVATSEVAVNFEKIGQVGDLGFYAEGPDFICSEPVGLKGDCQIVDGKTVVVTRGEDAFQITALKPSTYLEYGPAQLQCVDPPGPVQQKRPSG